MLSLKIKKRRLNSTRTPITQHVASLVKKWFPLTWKDLPPSLYKRLCLINNRPILRTEASPNNKISATTRKIFSLTKNVLPLSSPTKPTRGNNRFTSNYKRQINTNKRLGMINPKTCATI